MQRLLHSSKFWTAIVDAVISLAGIWAAYLVGDPRLLELVQQTIVVLQGVFIAIIAGIAWEDANEKRGLAASQFQVDKPEG